MRILQHTGPQRERSLKTPFISAYSTFMVFARVAAFFSQSHESQPTSSNEAVVVATTPVRGDDSQKPISKAVEMWRDEEEEEGRPPYQFVNRPCHHWTNCSTDIC